MTGIIVISGLLQIIVVYRFNRNVKGRIMVL
jgi:hypothetical protein